MPFSKKLQTPTFLPCAFLPHRWWCSLFKHLEEMHLFKVACLQLPVYGGSHKSYVAINDGGSVLNNKNRERVRERERETLCLAQGERSSNISWTPSWCCFCLFFPFCSRAGFLPLFIFAFSTLSSILKRHVDIFVLFVAYSKNRRNSLVYFLTCTRNPWYLQNLYDQDPRELLHIYIKNLSFFLLVICFHTPPSGLKSACCLFSCS